MDLTRQAFRALACLAFAAACIGAGPPAAFAGVATASQDATHLYLENDVLKIAVLRSNGSIDGIIHKQSGVNLQPNNANAWQGIWAMSMNAPDGANSFVQNGNTRSFVGTISTSAREAALVLTWKGLQLYGKLDLPNVTVVARISVRVDSPLSFWTLTASGLGTNSIVSIDYPFISGVGKLGQADEDDVLLLPQLKGTLFHNPTANLTQPTGSFYPSGYASMQMLAYYDRTSGFFVASDDSQGYTKDLWFGKSGSPAGDFTINAHSFLSGVPADTVTLPYNMIVGAAQGDWYSAADAYRSVAVRQPWAQQSRGKTASTWLHDMPLTRWECTHGCAGQPERTYAQFVQDMWQSRQDFGSSGISQLVGWEKYGAWVEGDYLPPQEGWSNFDALVQALRPGKLWLAPSPLFLDTATDLYRSGTMSASTMLDQQGKPLTMPTAGVAGGQWVYMDFSTEPWRQQTIDTYTTLARHGADLIQFDSGMVMGPQDCYNPAHSHTGGKGGNWQTQAWISLAQSIAAAVSAANPGATLSAEQPSEVYLPYFSLHYGSAVNQIENQPVPAYQEPVPLFQYVYHDSLVFADFMSPPVLDGSLFRLALARDLTWGQLPTYGINVYPDSLGQDAQAYLRTAITVRTTYAKKYLADGVMLPAPEISSPLTPVTWIVWSENNRQQTAQYPSIQHSAWRASDGNVGIVLTNITPASVPISLPLTYSRLGLAGGAAYSVEVNDGTSTSVLDSSLVKDSTYSLTLKPSQILLVELKSKAARPVLSPGGVVLHATASGIVSPGSLFDIYGSGLASSPATAPAGLPTQPTVLGNVQVLVNGIQAPLLYVGPTQIVAQIPNATVVGAASVVVVREGSASVAATVTVQQAAPYVLTFGSNRAVVQNQDYSINTSASPAPAGSYVVAYLMGSGPLDVIPADGTPAEVSPLSRETLATAVTVGAVPAKVTFSGLAPGFVGLLQVNLQVPDLPPGDYTVQVSIGKAQSNTPVMTIGPAGGQQSLPQGDINAGLPPDAAGAPKLDPPELHLDHIG